MRNFLLIVLTFSSLIVKANVRDSIPNGVPLNYPKGWVRYSEQVMADGGFSTLFIDTTARPKYPMFGILSYDSTIWWFNMVKWQKIASPTGLYVKYSDSNTIYITPTQLNDSLENFVTLRTEQTVDSRKIWDTTQKFLGDSIIMFNTIYNRMPAHQESLFAVNDSLKNMNDDGEYLFRNSITQINDSKSLQKTPGPLLAARQRLQLQKTQDTLNLDETSGATANILSSFNRLNSGDDTLNLYGIVNSNKSRYKILGSSLEVTGDTSLIKDKTVYWNLNLPMAGVFVSANVTNHGTLQEFDDLYIGNTNYLNGSSSDSMFTIQKRIGLDIVPLSSNAINQNSVAIYQQGQNDSVILNSSRIQIPNLSTSLAPTSYVLVDASGNVLRKSFIAEATALLDFPNTSAQTSSDLTLTVTGASVGNPVSLGIGTAAIEDNSCYTAWVSNPDEVTIRFNNYSSVAINPSVANFTVKVFPN